MFSLNTQKQDTPRAQIVRSILCSLLFMTSAPALAQDTIFAAAERGDLKAIQEFLKPRFLTKKVNLSAQRLSDHRTPLEIAIVYQQESVATELIQAGADVNLQGYDGFTPLTLAVKIRRSPQLISLLLARGGQVDLKTKDGRTPLLLATQYLDPDVSNILIQAGASIELATSDLRSRKLMFAAMLGQTEEVEELLDAPGELYDPELEATTPILLAHMTHHLDLVELLLQSGQIDLKHEIKAALYFGDKGIIPYLLNHHPAAVQPPPSAELGQFSYAMRHVIAELFEPCCTVCLEEITGSQLEAIHLTQCSHVLCEQCMLQWLGPDPTGPCPTCKEPIQQATNYRVGRD